MMSEEVKPARRNGILLWGAVAIGGLAILAIVLLGAFPVSMLRGTVESRLSAEYGSAVKVGGLERDSLFSFTPVIAVRDVTIAQPAWAGSGDFVRIGSASLRVPVFAVLFGSFRPDTLRIDGARIALVRSVEGRRNWRRDRTPDEAGDDADGGDPLRLTELTVANTLFSFDDRKRGLRVAGPLAIDARGVRADARGEFRGTPATLAIRAGRVTGVDPAALYPFEVAFDSPALAMRIDGRMKGTLNTNDFTADATIRAPTLKNFDRVVEAGLFGSQPIDFVGTVRHVGRDWFVDRLSGTMGRSRLVARATILKREGRTKVDANVRASQFDFDDLSDDEGRARAAGRRSNTGPRVIPPTRINLSKIGKTDARLVFRADRLLARTDTVFRSLRATASLENRVLRISDVVATLDSGRVTGGAKVDHRSGRPKLTLDLYYTGATLEALIGKPGTISGRVRGRIMLRGQGDTVREALARADGHAAMIATDGQVNTLAARVLGQDLGGVIGDAVRGPSQTVPLRCLVADFRGTNGVLVPRPLVIDTGKSVGRGAGRIMLDGERIDLTLSGAAKSRSVLRIADPIRIGGTLAAPSVEVAGLGTKSPPPRERVFNVLTKSIGQALGLGRKKAVPAMLAQSVNCRTMVAAAMR